jgi:hypothetical protein
MKVVEAVSFPLLKEVEGTLGHVFEVWLVDKVSLNK